MSHDYCELKVLEKSTAIYDVPVSQADGPVKTAALKPLWKTCVAKLFFTATVVNFVLLVVIIAIFTYFQMRNHKSLNSQGSGVGIGTAGPIGPPGYAGGAVYTRWGKNSCPSTSGTELLYIGITAGSRSYEHGGGANHLCLPNTPEYSSNITYRSGANGDASIWGTQYVRPIGGTTRANVPCVVCYASTRPTVVMIPAMASCPPTWTREYYGYIMADGEQSNRGGRSMFQCVDANLESSQVVPFFRSILRHVEAQCNDSGLLCPPYNNHQELNCVVCTK